MVEMGHFQPIRPVLRADSCLLLPENGLEIGHNRLEGALSCSRTEVMTQIGSEHSSQSGAPGPICCKEAIATSRSASARISTESATRFFKIEKPTGRDALRQAGHHLPGLPSSHQHGCGFALMSPRPNECSTRQKERGRWQ